LLLLPEQSQHVSILSPALLNAPIRIDRILIIALFTKESHLCPHPAVFGSVVAIVLALWLRVDVHENAFLPRSIDLLTIEAHDLSQLVGNGTITSVQIVQEYLRRIELDNVHGLQLRAVLSLSPPEDVFATAKMLDQERKDGRVRSSLHGLPAFVKVEKRLRPLIEYTCADAHSF
jgi:hypothetical protein